MMLSTAIFADPAAPKVLYQQALSEGRQLVVSQGRVMPASAMTDLLSPQVIDRVAGVFSLDVELRSNATTSLRLWSERCLLYRDAEYEEYQVLDLFVLPDSNRLVMAMAGPGSRIVVSEIGLYASPYRTITLRGADWSLLAAAISAPPGRLSAKLTYNGQEKRVEVQVTDFLQNTKQHTLFQQKGDQWEFVPVKQWQEKVPATDPTSSP